MCGIFAVTNAENAAKIAYLGLFALQHRGQESAGISTFDGTLMHTHRAAGLVSDVFDEKNLAKLQGNFAIGHVRYSTAGGNIEQNIQPIRAQISGAPVALVHNGNIVNAEQIRTELENSGSILQGTADTELVLHLIARSKKLTFIEKLKDAFQQLTGAFSFLILTPTHLYAAMDIYAYRPLSLGQLSTTNENNIPSWILASETCAMDLVGAEFLRDIAPGEIFSLELSSGKTQSCYFDSSQKRTQKCIFEHVYFARPDSVVWNILAYETRFEMGASLAKNNPVDADMVIAIPDSGVPMAMGYASASGIPYKIGLIRNHYVGRTFIEPTQNVRNFSVRLKLNPVRRLIRGKRIIVIDDSIVRGTTARKIMELLREAGAKEIHLRISAPPVKYPCFYGIDTPKKEELLAQNMSIAEMKDYLKADSLAFLSKDQLLQVMQKYQTERQVPQTDTWCTACFALDTR